ncbi:unnamed protein product [Chilo suppressalis]|uniref:DRBM domain-containing protein n=1 Tax=Chilo suppressalis TaxID=168631 RepID=A0ABN8ANW5_CHISP|nr:unnamed protein product [Chilo suppressalis]
MKTAVTVLQEMMVKMSQIPDYECISQSGPEHQAMFEYRCAALGAMVTAQARSKKEAKQEAARLMLRALAARGHLVPAPYGLHDRAPDGTGGPAVEAGAGVGVGARQTGQGGEAGGSSSSVSGGSRSYVALLQELGTEYRLPGVEYTLVGDTGPPHLRHFTVQARVGHRTSEATATTKKAARQKAAEQLYTYLRENLARLTADFVEEEALVRAHEKAMERYLESREETRRPDLGQTIADYHLGLVTHIEADKCSESLRQLELGGGEELERMLRVLGLNMQESVLSGGVHVVRIDAQPPLAFAGNDPELPRAAALRYLRRALAQKPPSSASTTSSTTG